MQQDLDPDSQDGTSQNKVPVMPACNGIWDRSALSACIGIHGAYPRDGIFEARHAWCGQVFIKSVVPGGACDRDGAVQVGDTVLSVNGENVVGLSVAEIRERIVGPIGSEVAVALESGATGQIYERVLVRGNAQPVRREDVSMLRSGAPDSQYQLSRSMDARLFQSQVGAATKA